MLLAGKRIFITEDNLINRSVMQMILESEGARIAFERWGRNTQQRLLEFAPIDLIILDLMLPDGITGFDVFDVIRSMPDFDNVPIIAVSAKDKDIAIPEVQAKGFNGFIPKPIDRLRFATQVASIINGEVIWGTE